MAHLPDFVQRLVGHFDNLPGIGPKTATKLVFFLLQDSEEARQFAHDLNEASDKTLFCSQCQNVSDQSLCSICRDPQRDQSTICIVADSQDLEAFERVHSFRGVYHILHGTINPIEGMTPDKLRIKQLIERLKQHVIHEIILGLDPTIEGEATAVYIATLVKPLGIRVTKPARGLPMGSTIEYADEVTLSSAMENRKEL